MKPGPSTYNCTEFGYEVEARSKDRPIMFQKTMLDREWRSVYFAESDANGVPTDILRHRGLAVFGLKSYEAAQALRWWALAATPMAWGIETRLMKYRVEMKAQMHEDEAVDGPGPLDGLSMAVGEAKP